MKTSILIVVFFAVLGEAFSFDNAEQQNVPYLETHMLQKRQITGPQFPNRCVFYVCIANCKRRGFKRGGYCTINGCQCLR